MTIGRPTSQLGEKTRRTGPSQRDVSPEVQALIACLEEAGATLLSLPPSGFSPSLRTTTLPVLREAAEAYGWSLASLRPSLPSAARISRVDRAMGYLTLIPQDRYLLRRIVGCRSLVHPVSGLHIFSWRRLGDLIGADHKAVQRWYADGLRIILDALRQQSIDIDQNQRSAKTPVMTAMPRRRLAPLDHP